MVQCDLVSTMSARVGTTSIAAPHGRALLTPEMFWEPHHSVNGSRRHERWPRAHSSHRRCQPCGRGRLHDRLHGAPTTPPRPPTWPTLAPASGASDASRRTVRAGRSRAGLAADRQKANGGQEVGQGENLKPGFFAPDGWNPRWRVCRNLSEPEMRPWRRHILVNRSERTGERGGGERRHAGRRQCAATRR